MATFRLPQMKRHSGRGSNPCGTRVYAGVCGAISGFILKAPFDTRMLDSDNGGECVNGHIKRHFSRFLPSVVRTRSHTVTERTTTPT